MKHCGMHLQNYYVVYDLVMCSVNGERAVTFQMSDTDIIWQAPIRRPKPRKASPLMFYYE